MRSSSTDIRQYKFGYGEEITQAIIFLEQVDVPRSMPENVTKQEYEKYKELFSNLKEKLVALDQGGSAGSTAYYTVRDDYCIKINCVKKVLRQHEETMQAKYGIDSGLPKPKADEYNYTVKYGVFSEYAKFAGATEAVTPPAMSPKEYQKYQKQLDDQSADLKRMYGL